MDLRFDSQDIEAWARLSGDRNPIHFNREAALRMNAADVVVHGMLAMLPIKQALGRAAAAEPGQDTAPWIHFKTLLKAPVLRDRDVSLALVHRVDRTGFKLRPCTGAAEHFIGGARRIEAPVWDSDARRITLPVGETEAWLRHFEDGLGKQLDQWVALDALVFGDFVRYRLCAVFDRLGPALRLDEPLDHIQYLSSHLLVQTTHQTVFAGGLCCAGALPPVVDYQIDNIDLVERDDEAVGTLDLGVHLQQRHVMTITLGLMIRKLAYPQENDTHEHH
ncbi:MaoC family dehydratase [Stenotrophomonas sp. CFBP8980]|uniref:MaoC family dehydratase n=1 Tax=Stenotrophomonas sp. CFBP8980 TaxID=3096523 RepID=UPI002A6AEBD1|nr:MaoC family dehydratase [Stenotrophomonas sp. CFBP8980]MDY1032223.1 MaoC family dehydratase [Stenotrophomonas sp. CFBP8980]